MDFFMVLICVVAALGLGILIGYTIIVFRFCALSDKHEYYDKDYEEAMEGLSKEFPGLEE